MDDVPITTFQYDVALSYASENRSYVDAVAQRLRELGVQVFYDKFEKINLWGEELPETFVDVFQKKAKLAIAFISAHYVRKPWPRHEGRTVLARALGEHEAYFLPVRLDNTELPGLRSTIGYIDGTSTSPDQLADLIVRKLETLPGRVDSVPIRVEAPTELAGETRSAEADAKFRDAVTRGDDLFLAMDLGGTKAYMSVMNADTDVFYQKRSHTESHNDSEGLFEFIKTCIRGPIDRIHEICGITVEQAQTKIKAIGLGFPGPTDFETGMILDAPNFRIKNYPLRDKIVSTFGIPTFVENDVNLAVLGESWKGAARGHANVVGIMIGTGIGGGLVIDGQIYRGRNKTAGEIGHMVLDVDSDKQCGCNQYGCFEALASRKSMARDLLARKLTQTPDSLIWNDLNLGSNEIAAYYEDGDLDTVAVVNRAAEVSGKAVFSILNLLNPDVIVITGGFVQQLGDRFLVPVRLEAMKCMNAVYGSVDRPIPIEIGRLPNPVLTGACKAAIDGTAGKKQYTHNDIIQAALEGLTESDLRLFASLYRSGKRVPVAGHDEAELNKARLRPLRNRGLIRTDTGNSFRNSRFIEITPLGRIVAEAEDL